MKVVEQGLVSLKMLHQNYFHAALKILKLTFSVFVFYGALDFLIFHFFGHSIQMNHDNTKCPQLDPCVA